MFLMNDAGKPYVSKRFSWIILRVQNCRYVVNTVTQHLGRSRVSTAVTWSFSEPEVTVCSSAVASLRQSYPFKSVFGTLFTRARR